MPVNNKNIVFIGLTGSGKTTVSSLVADELGMPWYDSDAEIERAEGMSVDDIFAQKGEAYFRAAETRSVQALCAMRGAVIAMGGGAVINNAALIRQASFVIYLRRGVGSILSTLDTNTRPMLKSAPERLYALEKERSLLYETTAHCVVDNEGSIEDAVTRVLEIMKSRMDAV